jgi:hypothetical protein
MRRHARHRSVIVALAALAALIAGCGVSIIYASFTIGGNVNGLAAGSLLILLLNGNDTIEITGNGPFAFHQPVPEGDSYSVTVGTQPMGQECSVTSGSGSGVTADVSSVSVQCF